MAARAYEQQKESDAPGRVTTPEVVQGTSNDPVLQDLANSGWLERE